MDNIPIIIFMILEGSLIVIIATSFFRSKKIVKRFENLKVQIAKEHQVEKKNVTLWREKKKYWAQIVKNGKNNEEPIIDEASKKIIDNYIENVFFSD